MAGQVSDRAGYLQGFREAIAALISVVILCIAAWMLMGTFRAARETGVGSEADAKQRADAFSKEKDIMLYGLALLGTVLGYYLGRVPAEMHAQEAQKNADTAQEQLAEAHDKLGQVTKTATDATATALEATKDRDQANKDKDKIKADLKTSLAQVQDSIKAAIPPQSKTLASGEVSPNVASLQQAQRELDALLKRWS